MTLTPDQLIDATATTESGGRYDMWNKDDNGAGVSVGIIQFNQKKGALPELLVRMSGADPDLFAKNTSPFTSSFLNEAWVRAADLNDAAFKPLIMKLLRLKTFQRVQRQLARAKYLEPAWQICNEFGMHSERAAAMCFDVAVQYGTEGLRQRLIASLPMLATIGLAMEATGDNRLLEILASRTDTHAYDANRRYKILASRQFLDDPWTMERPTVRRGDRNEAVRILQGELYRLKLIYKKEITGYFGSRTHNAVCIFQAARHLVSDGIVGPKTWAAIDSEP